MFDDLDEEFYDIVRQKLKLDVGEKTPVSPKDDESTNIKKSSAAETEATEDERDDHFNSSKEVIQNEVEDQSYDETNTSSVVIEERQSDLEAENYPEQAKEEILENKKGKISDINLIIEVVKLHNMQLYILKFFAL